MPGTCLNASVPNGQITMPRKHRTAAGAGVERLLEKRTATGVNALALHDAGQEDWPLLRTSSTQGFVQPTPLAAV